MSEPYDLDEYRHRNLAGVSLVETLEFEALERSAFSLEEWDAYSMEPVSKQEKRWAYLFRRQIDDPAYWSKMSSSGSSSSGAQLILVASVGVSPI